MKTNINNSQYSHVGSLSPVFSPPLTLLITHSGNLSSKSYSDLFSLTYSPHVSTAPPVSLPFSNCATTTPEELHQNSTKGIER